MKEKQLFLDAFTSLLWSWEDDDMPTEVFWMAGSFMEWFIAEYKDTLTKSQLKKLNKILKMIEQETGEVKIVEHFKEVLLS